MGIVRTRIFHPHAPSNPNSSNHDHHPASSSSSFSSSSSHLRKAIDEFIHTVGNAAVKAHELSSQAEIAIVQNNEPHDNAHDDNEERKE